MTEPVDLFFAKAVLKDKINDLAIQQLAHLMAMTREGHTCVKREECAALPLDLPSLHYTEKAVYLKKMWQYEETFCTHMHRLLSSPVLPVPFTGDPDLNLEQQKAVINALAHPFTIITGGPGTGKTFTAARIVKHLGMPQVVVAAPTGKAAANLEKGIGRPVRSGTLHSLLQIRSAKDFQNPYPYISADLLIVDECSMIDCQMFTYLLSALEAGKRVVLIGDRDQLPPVEGGSFFSDLIDSGVVPVTKLEICMRSDRREILEFAEAIRQGRTADVLKVFREKRSGLGGHHHLFPQPTYTPDISQLLAQANAFRILCCIRKGPQGVDALNAEFAEAAADACEPGQWLPIPILITRNSYDLKLFNGETGILLRKCGDSEAEEIAYFSDNRSFPVALLPAYEYAYCLSVHKSQGSEFDHVLVLAPRGSEVFGREVLYTAVTRAKLQLEIDGDEEVIAQAMAQHSGKISTLSEKLRI